MTCPKCGKKLEMMSTYRLVKPECGPECEEPAGVSSVCPSGCNIVGGLWIEIKNGRRCLMYREPENSALTN